MRRRSGRSNVRRRGDQRTEEATTAVVNEPSMYDVLLGRGRGIQQHPGNARFQEIVDMNQERYFNATSRHEMIHVTQQVVVAVQQHGRFLKYDRRRRNWVEVSEATARQKVSQALQYRRRQSSHQERGSHPSVGSAASAVLAAASLDMTNAAAVRGAAVAPIDPLSPFLPPIPAASAINIHPHVPAEPNTIEADADYLSVIRALSEGQHQTPSPENNV